MGGGHEVRAEREGGERAVGRGGKRKKKRGGGEEVVRRWWEGTREGRARASLSFLFSPILSRQQCPHFWLAAGLMGRSVPARAAAPEAARAAPAATAARMDGGALVHSAWAASRASRSVCRGEERGRGGGRECVCRLACVWRRVGSGLSPRRGMPGVDERERERGRESGLNGRRPPRPLLPPTHASVPPSPPPGTGPRLRGRRRRREVAWRGACEEAEAGRGAPPRKKIE